MKQVTIGIVCLARKTFDYKAAEQIYSEILSDLEKIPKIDLKAARGLVIEVEDAQKAAHELAEAHLDGLIVISGTFHLGHLVLELHKVLRVPIFLWGLPELPYDGGKIRLNSVCGVNLNASNLYKAKIRNYYANISNEVDTDWLDAIRIKAALQHAHVGIVGYRAKGFFNLNVDELDLYNKLGVMIDHYELADLLQTEVEAEQITKRKAHIQELFNTSALTEEQLTKVAELTEKFKIFVDMHKISALAIRCWPEFADAFGIAPCASMSILQAEGVLLTCEGDIGGAISMLAHQAISEETPFLADFSQVNFEEDFALMWHCGVAPCNLWDGKCERTLDTYFAGGKGVTAGFVMKEGVFSVCRLDSAGSDLRIFLQKGTAIGMQKDLAGTYFKCKFEKPVKEILERVLYTGIAHHISVIYGEFIEPFKIFARIIGVKIIK